MPKVARGFADAVRVSLVFIRTSFTVSEVLPSSTVRTSKGEVFMVVVPCNHEQFQIGTGCGEQVALKSCLVAHILDYKKIVQTVS